MKGIEKTDLPVGWAYCLFGDIANVQNGYAFKSSDFKKSPEKDHDVPLVRQSQLKTSLIDISEAVYLPRPYLLKHSNFVINKGDVIIGMSGSIGKVCTYADNVPALQNQRTGKIQPHTKAEISPKFFGMYLSNIERKLVEFSKGVGVQNISSKDIEALAFPLPPLHEQHRIVAKIEELFSELDEGIESLKTAREQLKVYRQALLKHAFEGKLTEKWREENIVVAGSKPALGVEVKGGRVMDRAPTKRRKDLPPLTVEELAELPELPQGWEWVKLGSIADLAGGVTKGKKLDGKETVSLPYLRVANVQDGHLNLSEIKYIDVEKQDGIKYQLRRGDVLYTEGGDKDKLGRGAVWNCLIDNCIHQNHIFRARIPDETVLPSFLSLFSQTKIAKKYFFRHAKQTTNLASINLTVLSNLPVITCSKNEQIEILRIIDEKLSDTDQLDKTITTALQQSETLRQAILKKAFSGQLVAQDENDEPASMLLERIRSEKFTAVSKSKRRKAEKICVETAPAKGKVIPFPVKISTISATDLHAGILGLAYRLHEQDPEKLAHFGHVKAEKISHLVESHLGIDLERVPFKDAAGPNDYPHLKKVESRARKANWFEVHQQASGAYVFKRKPGFDGLLEKASSALGGRLSEVEGLLKLLLPLNTRQAEIVATLYAAWNNLLLQGCSPQDEEIVFEARENWHQAKLNIERDKFFKGLEWMRHKGLVPAGKGRFVEAKGSGRRAGNTI